MPHVSVVCFLASYVLALVAELSRLAWRNRASHWVMLGLTAAGLTAQTLYLVLRSQTTGLPPLLSSAHDWLLVLAWLAVLVYLFVSLLDRDQATGLIVLPLVVGLVLASLVVPRSPSATLSAHQGWKMLHVSLLVFGIAGVLLGLVLGLMYLWQYRRLKQRQTLQAGLVLPSLELLARFNRLAILVSVPLLTFGMVLGIGLVIVSQGDALGERMLRDPLILGSGVCWLLMTGVFVWLLSSRATPGRKVAWLTGWSCGFLLLATIGTQALTTVLHGQSIHAPQSNLMLRPPTQVVSPPSQGRRDDVASPTELRP
jgi:ABC-type transport system involved in cytochrome c biogenesis permease subunit